LQVFTAGAEASYRCTAGYGFPSGLDVVFATCVVHKAAFLPAVILPCKPLACEAEPPAAGMNGWRQ
jgi:hypothetical protein